MWKKIKPYLFSILIALGVGGLSALLTKGNMQIYQQIKKPPLSPPMMAFPIVWGILFVLMGISSAIIYVKREQNRPEALSALRIYGLQLIVNFF